MSASEDRSLRPLPLYKEMKSNKQQMQQQQQQPRAYQSKTSSSPVDFVFDSDNTDDIDEDSIGPVGRSRSGSVTKATNGQGAKETKFIPPPLPLFNFNFIKGDANIAPPILFDGSQITPFEDLCDIDTLAAM